MRKATKNMNMNKSYIAGLFDGDGSVMIGTCTKSYQFKMEVTQCSAEFLNKVNEQFGMVGSIYTDKREDKYKGESASTLRICGIKSIPLLDIVHDYGVIKAEQAKVGRKYLQIHHQPGNDDVRRDLQIQMKKLNKDKTAYDKPYEMINDAYIAGIFDAEGNVYCNITENGRKRFYVKITQKSDPRVLVKIRDHLGFGCIPNKERYRLVFNSKRDILAFYQRVEPYINIKWNDYQPLIEMLKEINGRK